MADKTYSKVTYESVSYWERIEKWSVYNKIIPICNVMHKQLAQFEV